MSLSSLLLLTALQVGAPSRVTITPEDAQVAVGSTLQLTAAVYDSADNRISGASVRWISTDEAVVTVTGAGVVTGVRPGTARVAALVGARPWYVTITVPQLPADAIDLTMPPASLRPGTSVPLHVAARTRLGDEVPAGQVRFETSDPAVATVDRAGRVFLHRPGRATITAASGPARRTVAVTVAGTESSGYRLSPDAPTARTGDVIRFRATPADGGGALYPAWSVSGPSGQITAEEQEGVFVADEPGTYRVTAHIGARAVESAIVDVTRRHIPARLTTVGRGPTATHHAGDTWAFEGVDGRDYAIIGTFMHDWMKVWDVTDPARPLLTDSIQLDARRINDVKIHPNNRIGIVTREGASNRRNGMVLLDLATPAHPTVLSEYTETVTGGVHNVWMTSDDLVYACHNGTSELHIIDISDPQRPREVGRWGLDKADKTLHDVIVQDGYAFLSYWDDGVVILDVGAGTHGGTPTDPQFVSQYAYPIGNTHVAWRAGRYLFLGDEIFPPNWNADAPIEARGYIHVVDVSDIEHPVEVAKYEVPEAGAHNVWVEGDRLYVGYYQGGLRVVDISGELRGDLYRQGRELAVLKTTDANTTVPNWPMTWGAQVFKGHIFTSDLNSGLWILKLDEQVVIP